jgi:rod shape determining protein RodA
MAKSPSIFNKLDWPLLMTFLILMVIGLITIYAAGYNPDHPKIYDISQTYGKQLIWIGICLVLGFIIINMNSKVFSVFAYAYYGIILLLLIVVLFIAKEVNGAKAWIDLGFFRLQPSEFAKFTTCLGLAYYISELETNLAYAKKLMMALGIIIIPFILILAQHDMGSALVFLSFAFLLNRFGMSDYIIFAGFFVIIISILSLLLSPVYLILSMVVLVIIIAFFNRKSKDLDKYIIVGVAITSFVAIYSISIDLVMDKLDKHQKDRINVLVGKGGNDWNVRQSKIALGAGQFSGKGFLKGTQSKMNFLPAKETDFIFCTIGEEWGFLGCGLVIGLYVFLMMRILYLSEKHSSKFSKVYGYAIVCVLMMHFIINIGMTVGLVPVIGIPLPALSYGGSSLLSFSVMIFAFIRMDSERWIYTS